MTTLRFTEFNTQAANDVMRVYQCSDVYCSQQQQLAELSGTYPIAQAMTATTGFMKLVFTSDGSVNLDGFTASWSTVYSHIYVCVHMYVYMFHVCVCVCFMKLVFPSDGSVNAAGFTATWTSVCMMFLFSCPIDT